MTGNQSSVANFQAQIQAKIDSLLSEFAEGKLNREQFHAIYAHYTDQLNLTKMALRDQGMVKSNAGETIAIRRAHMGKAIGLAIVHHKSGTLVDTLGNFDVDPALIAPTLNDFGALRDAGQYIERRIIRTTSNQWLLFAAGRFTTVVTQFQNEPSSEQSREIERLHYDFEIANEAFLSGATADTSQLAYPFLVFVQQKLKRN